MSASTIERQWTAHGLDCAVVWTDMGARYGHRCGYVRVPEDHPWHGLDYDAPALEGPADYEGRSLDDAGMSGTIAALAGQLDEWATRIEGHVAIHGGLTYAGCGVSDLSRGWWFGFDCAHLDDTPAEWTEQRTAEEVERLAEQVAAVGVQAQESP